MLHFVLCLCVIVQFLISVQFRGITCDHDMFCNMFCPETYWDSHLWIQNLDLPLAVHQVKVQRETGKYVCVLLYILHVTVRS